MAIELLWYAFGISDISVRFPEIREDLIDGYKWVLDTLPTIAPVDASRVFVMGGSAGGYSTLSVVRI